MGSYQSRANRSSDFGFRRKEATSSKYGGGLGWRTAMFPTAPLPGLSSGQAEGGLQLWGGFFFGERRVPGLSDLSRPWRRPPCRELSPQDHRGDRSLERRLSDGQRSRWNKLRCCGTKALPP
jgi:hypothetical protein